MKNFLKIFLIVLVCVIVLGGILCGGSYFFCNSKVEEIKTQMNDNSPKTLENRARSIAEYTLPPNVTLKTAIDMMGIKFAVFADEPAMMWFVLAEVPSWMMDINEGNFKQKVNAKEIQEQLRKNGRTDVEIRDVKVLEEGKLPTATKEVPYVKMEMTVFDNKSGQTMQLEGIIAVMDFQSPKKSIFYISGSPMGTFNMDMAKEFLKTIKVT